MLWNIAYPFSGNQIGAETQVAGRWIDDFCESDRHKFRKIDSPANASDNWHNRRSRGSPLSQWGVHWEHARRALRGADGIITVFPQLATVTSTQQTTRFRRIPHVAWCFNVGRLPGGVKKYALRKLLRNVSRFVVHSTGERRTIADYLNLPLDSVQFVPFQHSAIPVYCEEDSLSPFIVAMGSANRDYATLLRALSLVKIPTVIVAAPRAMENLELPPHVKHMHGLSSQECFKLTQRARFSVVPLEPTITAAGQVTVVESLVMGRAVVATYNVGTVDYIANDSTGILVPPKDPVALSHAILRLWEEPELARRYGANGASFAERELSDPVAGRNLLRVLTDVADTCPLSCGYGRSS